MSNLLHVSANVFPPLNIEHSTKNIWRELSKGFNEYHILGRSNDNKFHYYVEGNLHLHLVPNLYKAASFSITSFYLLKILKKHKINIVLSQCPILGGFTANLVCRYFKIPVFQEIHDTYYFDLFKSEKIKDKVLAKIMKFSVKKATKVRALNKMMADMIMEVNNKSDIVIIENRVDLNKFKVEKKNSDLHDPISITSIGTFVNRKGYHTAIQAIKELSSEYKIKLTLIGGGKEKSNLEELAKDYNNIELYDRISQEELAVFLKETDIYIQPSIREGMPRTILEAMAMKLPVITTNVSSIPGTVLHLENGIIIEPENVKELKEAIILIIENRELRDSLIKNAYTDVSTKFEWNSSFDIYRKEIKKIAI